LSRLLKIAGKKLNKYSQKLIEKLDSVSLKRLLYIIALKNYFASVVLSV